MLGEPKIAVGTRGDSRRAAVRMRQFDVCDLSVSRDAADAVADRIGEPDCAVGARGYSFGETIGIDFKSFGRAVRSHLSDRVALVFGEPQVAVETGRDCVRRMRPERHSGWRWLRAWNGGRDRQLRRLRLLRRASLRDRECGGKYYERQRAADRESAQLTIRFALSSEISPAPNPNSPRISSVCCPRSGGWRHSSGSVREKRAGDRTARTRPALGCSYSKNVSLATNCGSFQMES